MSTAALHYKKSFWQKDFECDDGQCKKTRSSLSCLEAVNRKKVLEDAVQFYIGGDKQWLPRKPGLPDGFI
jgi:hypothetical protein